MRRKSLRIQVEVPGWNSMDSNSLLNEVKENVFSQLKQQNRTVSEAIVIKSCKNALSLARSKKKNTTKFLVVYISQNCIDSNDTCSSNLVSSISVGDEENSKDAQVYSQLIFSFDSGKGLVIEADFVYLKNMFSCLLSRSSIATDLTHFLNDICTYCFDSAAKFYINVLECRRELRRRLSNFVRNAKEKAKARDIRAIQVLTESNNFVFYLKSVEPVHRTDEFLSSKFDSFASNKSSDRILLVRDKDQICVEPRNKSFYMYISESFAFRALEQFEFTNVVDIDELVFIAESYCQQRGLILNTEKNVDNLKTCILNRRIDVNQSKFFSCMIDLADKNLPDENYNDIDLDALLGPVYSTRGIKRNNQEVAIDTDDSDFEAYDNEQDELWQENPKSSAAKHQNENDVDFQKEELLRQFLHIKDEHHITDSAIKAIHAFFRENKEPLFSMAEIERVRKRCNQNIPLKYTKDSAYVPFEFALRAAVFVAIKFRPDLLKLNHLSFRLNMDGTLMGNKHVVAISVNCVDGGPSCQTARRLVPVGIFEIQKESNELLRKTLPKDFLDSIQSVKRLKINHKKTVTVKIRLGGDYQNSVYVFGLAGVHSNYPCVFCTQNKSYLHVTEKNTVCEEEVWVGSGKNRKKVKEKKILNPTSVYDPTLGARTLAEKSECLKKKEKNRSNNELGYQSEPLFGDLFEFSDYVLDTLHMRLRIFDIILKDILAEASRTGEYEPTHTKKLEEKVDVLNKHANSTIGKRFFFKLETENNVKTIASCGRFSGHLQEIFFVDSFPYEKIIQNEELSKNAKNLVQKFKFILQLIKTEKSQRTTDLAEVAKSFVKEFRQSGLRTGCTPYMHLIGTHLAEQDKNEDLRAYDMQGVEKSNDLLSRLYFSSSNRAKNPLRTMVQSLYRRLEMNFADPKDRVAMNKYSLKGTLGDPHSEEDNNSTDDIFSYALNLNQSNESSFNDSESGQENDNDEDVDQTPHYVTQNNFRVNRRENRWKSFKKR